MRGQSVLKSALQISTQSIVTFSDVHICYHFLLLVINTKPKFNIFIHSMNLCKNFFINLLSRVNVYLFDLEIAQTQLRPFNY